MAMMRAAAPSTDILAPRSETPPLGTPPLLHIPLPTSSPPLLLPSTNRRADVLEVTPTGGFRAYYGFVGTLDAEIRRELDKEIGYGITDVWEDPDEITKEIPAIDVAELSQRMTDFVTAVRQDTGEIYGRLDDAQDDSLLMSGQPNSLCRDRRSHARTARLMESESIASRKAWVQSMDASDTTRSKKMAPKRTTRSSPATTTTTTIPDTKGVVELTQWFEIMETVFHISNYTVENQIKFATCTLLGSALTRWNSHVKTVGHDVAYAMTWTNLKKKINDKYFPRGKIKKLEVEM
nr:reverse transcriptase domain-containing protein [Tanacetum cinerariifolium]